MVLHYQIPEESMISRMHEAPMTWTTIRKARPTQKLEDLKQKYEKLAVAVLQIKLQTNSPTEATWN